LEGFEQGVPIAKRAVIVCPSSLVSNWENEIQKWLKVGIAPGNRLSRIFAIVAGL